MRFWRRRHRRGRRSIAANDDDDDDGTDAHATTPPPTTTVSSGGGVSDDENDARDDDDDDDDDDDVGAFVRELRDDGTLVRLERAAKALRRVTTPPTTRDEKTVALDAYLRRDDENDDEEGSIATHSTKVLLDDDDDDDDSRAYERLEVEDVTKRCLRLDSTSSRSYSRSSDAAATRTTSPMTPTTTPVMSRSLAMRRLRERHSNYSTDDVIIVVTRDDDDAPSASSEGYTPPRLRRTATPRSSLDGVRRDVVGDSAHSRGARLSSHKSLENQRSMISSTSSSSSGDDFGGDVGAPRKPKKKPSTPYPLTNAVSARALDAATLTEKLRDALRGEPGVEQHDEDVFASTLQRSLRSMTVSTPTVGLCLLSRVDEIVHVIEGESTKHACFALELERSKVESMYRLSGYINAIPSKRLRDALLDMHKAALENIERQFHARMVSAQRRYLDSIISDVRVSSRFPRDSLGAFEYMSALCLDLDARDSRLYERFF